MSLARAALIAIQAFLNGKSTTPPNPTAPKQRYHTEEMYILQIAPLIFKYHQVVAYFCAAFEVLYYLRSLIPSSFFNSASPLHPIPTIISTAICPVSASTSSPGGGLGFLPSTYPTLLPTPPLLLGVLAVILGAYIRLDCYKTLGRLFTFDLTVHPDHQLITRRFYAYVRHPAYTGSLLLVFGLALAHLTRGSWMVECGPIGLVRLWGSNSSSRGLGITAETLRIVIWATWWLWTFCVGISRADAEDKQMRKLFREEWDAYAAAVQWWFFPGLI